MNDVTRIEARIKAASVVLEEALREEFETWKIWQNARSVTTLRRSQMATLMEMRTQIIDQQPRETPS